MRAWLAEADAVVLSSHRLALTLDLDFGCRVTSMTDRSTGRQWLVQGPGPSDTSEAAVYRGAASRGWDECFPTVLPCRHPAWGGRLRDHGMLWGRAWSQTDLGRQHLTAQFEREDIRFSRSLTLEGVGLTAAYAVTSARATPVPYLWSQHCVLDVTSRDRIALAGQGRMDAAGSGFEWPAHPSRDLSRVGRHDEGFVVKCYGPTPALAMAQVAGPNGGLRFDWDGAEVPAIGLWLNYGGWPEEGPLHHVALEPTTGAADDLSGAEALGQARWLAPGETHRWSVRLTLLDPEEGQTP